MASGCARDEVSFVTSDASGLSVVQIEHWAETECTNKGMTVTMESGRFILLRLDQRLGFLLQLSFFLDDW